jgi:hypothetical protein
MFQHVGANDVVETSAQWRQAVIQIRTGEFYGWRMGRVGPIDTGHGKSARRQSLREIADGTTHIQYPAPFAAFRKLCQQ